MRSGRDPCPGRITSLPPAQIVTRSGFSASAASIWSSEIWRISLPRTARFAYAKSSAWDAEHLGDAVGPASMAAGGVGFGITDALGERIAERDHASPRVRFLVLDERRACVRVVHEWQSILFRGRAVTA